MVRGRGRRGAFQKENNKDKTKEELWGLVWAEGNEEGVRPQDPCEGSGAGLMSLPPLLRSASALSRASSLDPGLLPGQGKCLLASPSGGAEGK